MAAFGSMQVYVYPEEPAESLYHISLQQLGAPAGATYLRAWLHFHDHGLTIVPQAWPPRP